MNPSHLLLLVILVLCALSVVTAQDRTRVLYQQLEREQQNSRRYETEHRQLQLELGTLTAHARIEQEARQRLGMVSPNSAAAYRRP